MDIGVVLLREAHELANLLRVWPPRLIVLATLLEQVLGGAALAFAGTMWAAVVRYQI